MKWLERLFPGLPSWEYWEGVCNFYAIFQGRCRAPTAYLWYWAGDGEDIEDLIAEMGDLVKKDPAPLGHDGFLVSVTAYRPDGAVEGHRQVAGRKRKKGWEKAIPAVRESLASLHPSPATPLVEVQLVNEGEEFLNRFRGKRGGGLRLRPAPKPGLGLWSPEPGRAPAGGRPWSTPNLTGRADNRYQRVEAK